MARKYKGPSRHTAYRNDGSLIARVITIPRLAALMVFVLAVGLVIGTRIGGEPAQAADKTKQSVKEVAERSAGPSRYDGDVPIGYTHNEEGAIAAASAFISVPPQLLLRSTEDAAIAVTKLSTKADGERLALQMQQAYDTVRVGIASAQQTIPNPRFFVQLIPVGNEVVRPGVNAMVVKLWVLELDVIEGLTNPSFAFTTHVLSLKWEKGDWKISNWGSTPGPTPIWAPSPATPVGDFLTLVEKMRPYKYEAK